MNIPEYHPPPRVEAWLTLPPGVVVARDDPDWYQYVEQPRYPQVHSEFSVRFRKKFGNEAALSWDLEPEQSWLLNRTVKEVWTTDALSKQFGDANPFLPALDRNA